MIWLSILLYTVISVGFFVYNVGNKFREERWYDWPLMPPVLVIIYTFAWSCKALGLVVNVAHKLKIRWICFRNKAVMKRYGLGKKK